MSRETLERWTCDRCKAVELAVRDGSPDGWHAIDGGRLFEGELCAACGEALTSWLAAGAPSADQSASPPKRAEETEETVTVATAARIVRAAAHVHEAQDKPKPGEKRCSRCKRTKAASAFGPSLQTKDRLNGWCKDCRAEHARLRWLKDHGTPDPRLPTTDERRDQIRDAAERRQQRPTDDDEDERVPDGPDPLSF